jgi:hypothetical protein
MQALWFLVCNPHLYLSKEIHHLLSRMPLPCHKQLLVASSYDYNWYKSGRADQHDEFNNSRPHSSLGYRTPNEFSAHWQADQTSATLRPDPPASASAKYAMIRTPRWTKNGVRSEPLVLALARNRVILDRDAV